MFLVNLAAGRFKRDPGLLPRLAAELGGRGEILATRTLSELDDAVSRALSLASVLVIAGGDGTYLACLTALARAAAGGPLPPLVLTAGGTVSIAARNWSGERDPIAVARIVAGRPHALRFVPRPTLLVSDGDGSARIGFTFGTGLVANFFDVYERAGATGNLAAAGIAAKTFVHSLYGGHYAERILSPLPCRLEADGTRLEPEAWSLVVVSVLADVGLGFRVNHRAAEDPARPHVVASPLPPVRLGPQVFRVLRGLPLRGAGNFDGLVEKLRLSFPEGAGRYVLDGDTFRADTVTVSAGPTVFVAG